MKTLLILSISLMTSSALAYAFQAETYQRIKPHTMNTQNVGITDRFGNSLATSTGDGVTTSVPSTGAPMMAKAETTAMPAPTPTPAPAPTGLVKRETFKTLDVPFATNSTQVGGDWINQIRTFVQSLKGKNYSKVELTGFSDPRGNADYNAALSKKRAKAVEKVLTEVGMSSTQLEVIGAGVRNDTSHAGARVVEIRVLR